MDKLHLLYIDCLFITSGHARPMQLQTRFCLSRSKASRLFSAYKEMVGNYVYFDAKLKNYQTTYSYESLSGWGIEKASSFMDNVSLVFDDVGACPIETKKKGSPLAG